MCSPCGVLFYEDFSCNIFICFKGQVVEALTAGKSTCIL